MRPTNWVALEMDEDVCLRVLCISSSEDKYAVFERRAKKEFPDCHILISYREKVEREYPAQWEAWRQGRRDELGIGDSGRR